MFILMVVVFVLGYAAIALEHPLKIDKAASAIILGALMWVLFVVGKDGILDRTNENGQLSNQAWNEYLLHHKDADPSEAKSDFIIKEQSLEHLGDTSEVLFFLLCAMTIVAIIDKHNGFSIITDRIKTKSKSKLLWLLSILTFFMSAVLDNLTTTIVMVTLLNKLVADKHLRWIYAGMIVLAANAGGAWSPIGDVTTIMLWIGGQITAANIIKVAIVPSMVSMIVPLAVLSLQLKGDLERPEIKFEDKNSPITEKIQKFALYWGIASLIAVPILKTFLHLPPYLGMLLVLGIFWVITEIWHRRAGASHVDFTVSNILTTVDTPTILFFLGILTAVGALQSAGHLALLSQSLETISGGNVYGIGIIIGVLSSIVDNVPLVAGAMGMYGVTAPDSIGFLSNFVQDGVFWELLAYTAGTGGSILIIGSAAGVAAMGLEKIDFVWYLKHISWLALLGFFAGAGCFALLKLLF